MRILRKYFPFAAVALVAWSMQISPQFPHEPLLVGSAEARLGRPVSPGSVAGVARRTTRRAVVATSATASASQQQQAQQQAAPAPQPAPAATLPAGTVVSALPAGCTSMVVEGVSLFSCSGVTYQPTFQSNNLVYVIK